MNTTAGIGVLVFLLIMVKILGMCPSLAPTKNSLEAVRMHGTLRQANDKHSPRACEDDAVR